MQAGTQMFLGGLGPLEIVGILMPFVLVTVLIYLLAKKIREARLPGYSADFSRISEDEVEVKVTGKGTASKIQVVVDGEVRDVINASPNQTSIVEISENEELSIRKVGGV